TNHASSEINPVDRVDATDPARCVPSHGCRPPDVGLVRLQDDEPAEDKEEVDTKVSERSRRPEGVLSVAAVSTASQDQRHVRPTWRPALACRKTRSKRSKTGPSKAPPGFGWAAP